MTELPIEHCAKETVILLQVFLNVIISGFSTWWLLFALLSRNLWYIALLPMDLAAYIWLSESTIPCDIHSIYSVYINEPYLKISLEKELLHRNSALSSLKKKSNYPINGLG